ncbi:MAG: YdaS family helix-turn-helix protein [Polymorphobacter sp.]
MTTTPRTVLLAEAAEAIGGQRALARALGVGERSVRAWLAGERSISDGVLLDAETAVERHITYCQSVIAKMEAARNSS